MERVAIVTGATSGIGEAYARLLGKEGWNLIITGRREEIINRVATSIEDESEVSVKIVICDFNYSESFSNFISIISEMKIGFLVNCVGFSNHNDFFMSEFKENHRLIEAHISALSETIHTVVPGMKSLGGGWIINVSSLAGFLPSLSDPFYSGTKAFINTYSESISMILKGDGIKVQSLCPGYTYTDFHKDMNLPEKAFRNRGLKRWLKPEYVTEYSYRKRNSSNVIVIPGISNKIVYNVVKSMPKRLYYKLAGRKRSLDE